MNDSVKLLSPPTNYAVVQLPGRKFPGVVFQGDSLHQLLVDLRECAARAAGSNDVRLREDLATMTVRMEDVIRGYEHVLTERGIELPY